MVEGLFEGYKVRSLNVEVNQLQFADGTLFVGVSSTKNILVLKVILRCFELASNLKVNFHKSKFKGVNMLDECLMRYAFILNCNVRHIPFDYLGLKVWGNPRKERIWDGFLENVKKSLSK